jgi:putative nucleotidyltransferase with HDIG domain
MSRLPELPANSGFRAVALDTVLARIHALPSLSPVVVRALDLTYRELTAPREITAVIEGDLRFSIRVVNAANAPCHGLPRQVKTVAEAILLLGADGIRQVVLVAAARDVFARPLPGYGLTARDLWGHSVACGMAAEIVAEMTNYSNPTEAFIAGLLHDVGKVVLNEEMQRAAPYVRGRINQDACTFVDAERMVLGFDHCDVGARVARSWGIPQHIVQAIGLHRKPIVERQTVPLAGYVHLGEILCCLAGIGIGFEGLEMRLDTRVLTDFKFTEAMADIAVSRLVDKIAASASLLQVPVSGAK